MAAPSFWIAILLLVMVLFFAWTPPIGYAHIWQDPWLHIQKVLWPALILGWHYSGYIARMTRSSLLDVLRQDYIRTARSKGLQEQLIIVRHALRNALIPVVTIAGVYMGSLLGGAVILETIFGIPGIGFELVDSLRYRDYPVTQSLAVFFVALLLVMNLLVDLTYGLIDPRVRYS